MNGPTSLRPAGSGPLAAPLRPSAAGGGPPGADRWQGDASMRSSADSSAPASPPGWAMAAPWLLCGLISASQAYFLWPPKDAPPSFLYDLAWQLPPWLFLALAAPQVARVARRFPIGRETWTRSLPPHLLANFVLAAGHASVVVATGYVLGEVFFVENSVPVAFGKILAKLVQTELFTYWLIVALVHAFDYHRKAREGVLVAARLETALAQAQLEALKMQLHPHFLFNTLNTIGVLVRKHDMQGALRMLSGVGDLLRHALAHTGRQLVPLKQELDFLRRYLEIEQIRFCDRLDVRMNIAPEVLAAQVPNLMLQPLVENAIRHGIAPRAAAGRIEVEARQLAGALTIEVRDDGVGLPPGFDAGACAGVGLRNVQARLRQLYPGAHDFAVRAAPTGGVVVRLQIPRTLEETVDDAA